MFKRGVGHIRRLCFSRTVLEVTQNNRSSPLVQRGRNSSGLLIKTIRTVISRGVGVCEWQTSATSYRQQADDRCSVAGVALHRLYRDAATV